MRGLQNREENAVKSQLNSLNTGRSASVEGNPALRILCEVTLSQRCETCAAVERQRCGSPHGAGGRNTTHVGLWLLPLNMEAL
jgi:hypothetical protein